MGSDRAGGGMSCTTLVNRGTKASSWAYFFVFSMLALLLKVECMQDTYSTEYRVASLDALKFLL